MTHHSNSQYKCTLGWYWRFLLRIPQTLIILSAPFFAFYVVLIAQSAEVAEKNLNDSLDQVTQHNQSLSENDVAAGEAWQTASFANGIDDGLFQGLPTDDELEAYEIFLQDAGYDILDEIEDLLNQSTSPSKTIILEIETLLDVDISLSIRQASDILSNHLVFSIIKNDLKSIARTIQLTERLNSIVVRGDGIIGYAIRSYVLENSMASYIDGLIADKNNDYADLLLESIKQTPSVTSVDIIDFLSMEHQAHLLICDFNANEKGFMSAIQTQTPQISYSPYLNYLLPFYPGDRNLLIGNFHQMTDFIASNNHNSKEAYPSNEYSYPYFTLPIYTMLLSLQNHVLQKFPPGDLHREYFLVAAKLITDFKTHGTWEQNLEGWNYLISPDKSVAAIFQNNGLAESLSDILMDHQDLSFEYDYHHDAWYLTLPIGEFSDFMQRQLSQQEIER